MSMGGIMMVRSGRGGREGGEGGELINYFRVVRVWSEGQV